MAPSEYFGPYPLRSYSVRNRNGVFGGKINPSGKIGAERGGRLRLKHIDRVRAIAVLFMIEVHTAAIIPPEGISVGHPAAFVAAAFGGMAAPMFVTISGWGMYGSAKRRASGGHGFSEWARWILPRVTILCICQLAVNILLNVDRGGRFEWQTPGVLTLLAFAAMLSPVLVRLGSSERLLAMLLMCFSPLLLGGYAGSEMGWFERVGSEGMEQWLSRFLWNGTYPVAPWLFFVLLGTLLHDLGEDPSTRERGIALGLLATSATLFIAIVEDVEWALTSGEAVLTFFPASTPFLVVSGTMVALLIRFLEGEEGTGGEPYMGERISFLEPTGRLSLTIYVSHFAVLGVVASVMEGEARLGVFSAFAATVLHTLIWIPLAYWHEKKIPNYSLEGILRSM